MQNMRVEYYVKAPRTREISFDKNSATLEFYYVGNQISECEYKRLKAKGVDTYYRCVPVYTEENTLKQIAELEEILKTIKRPKKKPFDLNYC